MCVGVILSCRETLVSRVCVVSVGCTDVYVKLLLIILRGAWMLPELIWSEGHGWDAFLKYINDMQTPSRLFVTFRTVQHKLIACPPVE